MMLRKIRHLLAAVPLLGLALGLSPQSALAGDAALYGPSAPPGSAFVRVFNTSDQADLIAKVGGETIDEVPAWGASEFVFVPAGSHAISIGSASTTASLKADRYYTAVADKGAVRLLDVERYSNRLKALLIVYNLTDSKSLSLRTADGKTPIVAGVATGSLGSREVNAAKVTLAVYDGETAVGTPPAVNLQRGKAASLFVVGDASAPRFVWSLN